MNHRAFAIGTLAVLLAGFMAKAPITVCAQGLVANSDEDEVALWVAIVGGSVDRDDKKPGKPITSVSLFFGSEITDDGLKEMRKLTHLETLYLNHNRVTDTGAKNLAQLRQVEKSSTCLSLWSPDKGAQGVACN